MTKKYRKHAFEEISNLSEWQEGIFIHCLNESDGFEDAASIFILGKTRPNSFLISNFISNSDDYSGVLHGSCIYYVSSGTYLTLPVYTRVPHR